MKIYYEQLYANKLNSLDKVDKFLKKHTHNIKTKSRRKIALHLLKKFCLRSRASFVRLQEDGCKKAFWGHWGLKLIDSLR